MYIYMVGATGFLKLQLKLSKAAISCSYHIFN